MLFYTHIYIYFFLISQLQSYETPEHQHQNETVNTKLLSDATGKWKGSLSIKKSEVMMNKTPTHSSRWLVNTLKRFHFMFKKIQLPCERSVLTTVLPDDKD